MPKNAKNLAEHGNGAGTLVYLGLGGTGIRSVEPLLHLCALGLGPRVLKLVLIDPDLKNAAVDRVKGLVKSYNEVRDRVNANKAPGVGYFRTEVQSAVGREMVWSPVADDDHMPDMRFSARVDRSLMDQRGGRLGRTFDFLFAEQFQKMDLGMGFRGVPSIGTVFMNRLRDQDFFRQLLSDQTNAVFFAVGSVFGGTGAAALPVVGRSLVDGIASEGTPGEGDDRPAVPGVAANRVGAALVLPFFTLPPEVAGSEGGPRPRAELFAQNAAAALPTYYSGSAKYGKMYVVGDSEARQQKSNEVGGGAQNNASHYVELYAALAALDFAARAGDASAAPSTFEYIAVGDDTEGERADVGWDDLPIAEESVIRLKGGLAAVHTFLSVFRPNGGSDPQLARRVKGATWMAELGIQPRDLTAQSSSFDAIGKYFMRIWEWLADLRESRPSLGLARANRDVPTRVHLSETLEGFAPRRRFRDEFEVFREWNLAASRCRNYGSGAFLEMMRQGSEAFARTQFAEPARPASASVETV
jgi:hypothetical protein